jgi:hypothetical protein
VVGFAFMMFGFTLGGAQCCHAEAEAAAAAVALQQVTTWLQERCADNIIKC